MSPLTDSTAPVATSFEQVGTDPMVALRATAAHELFHLVQFAYDVREDPWLVEGTATWMDRVV